MEQPVDARYSWIVAGWTPSQQEEDDAAGGKYFRPRYLCATTIMKSGRITIARHGGVDLLARRRRIMSPVAIQAAKRRQ